jgi:hypothetical protein
MQRGRDTNTLLACGSARDKTPYAGQTNLGLCGNGIEQH